MHSDSWLSRAVSVRTSWHPFFVLMQLYFMPTTFNNFSVILQNSFEIVWPPSQEHFSFFTLQSWHIGWRSQQRYHCFFPGLAWPRHIWQTKSFRNSVKALLEFSWNDAILTNVSNLVKKTPNLSSTQSGQRTPARLSNWKNEKLTGFNWVRAGFNSTSADEFVHLQFRKNRNLWNTLRSWLNYYKMAWFILQNDVTANEFKNIWEPERNHWIIKPNLEEEPNFAYFPAKTESNVPVLIESATKLDPDFKQFHKFKLTVCLHTL